MAGYRPTQIRKPSNETEFEKNCVVLFRELLRDPNVKRLGTRGQRQHGVDLVGHRDRDPKEIVGIQCKLKSGTKKLTKEEVQKEVKAALGYKPPLREYFIVATSKDDTKLDQYAQQLMQEQEARGRRIRIEIWGWDTLEEKIGEYEAAKNAFDPGFSPSVASQGRKLGALLVGQKKQATQSQVTALITAAEREARGESTRLPTKYADRELQEELSRVLRRRGFVRTDTAAELAALADRAIDGDLALGSRSIRAEICDRAARANASQDMLEAARRFREHAVRLDPSRDLFIADAVLKEAAGDPDGTLRELKTRTDPDTRSALLTTLIRQRGKEAALDWARVENLKPVDFNAPGALNLVLKEIESGEFDRALTHVSQTPAPYFSQCPALLMLRGQLALASILPVDQKAAIFQGLPLNPRLLQLASGPSRQEIITSVDRDFITLLGLTAELGVEFLDDFLSEMDLWLRLENPETEQAARRQLGGEIGDPAKTLRRVRLALAYDVPFNTEALQRHLTAQRELGGWNPDELFAAFLIVLNSNDPNRLTDFFETYHNDLFAQEHLVRAPLAGIEIEALARAGRFDQARTHIDLHHRAKHLSVEQARDITEIVAHIEAGDEVENLRQRYAVSGHLSDLRPLIHGLRARRDDKQLAVYAPTLARATRTQEDLDLAMKSLFRAGRFADVIALTEELPDLFALDNEYAAVKGWSFYRLGRVMEARGLARDLLARRDFAGDRELAVNTAIESGDWGHLQAILAREAARTDSLPVGDLLRLARLALEAGSAYVDHFRDAALQRAPDDPQVNLNAFVLATERGEEDRGSQAHEWLEKAARLSGAEGPVRSVPMRQLVEDASGWNERVENVDKLLRRAEIPLFIAAKAVRRQIIDLTLGQALRNTDADDKRLRFPVFGFFGLQGVRPLPSLSSVALDLTAIITLDYLELLETVLDSLEHPLIAPGTLSTLFIQRQFLKIQQPSKMAKAERLQSLLATDRLKVIPGETDHLPALAKEVGRDLATLLAVAEREKGLVVRSAPVPKIGTFLDETVDMTRYASVLTDTRSVLGYLVLHGRVDAEVKKRAEAYLHQVDKGWGTAATVDGNGPLYLDDLAVTYLDYVGILEPLVQSGIEIFVHEDVDRQTRETLRYGKHVNELLDAVERIRATLNKRIETGAVKFSSRRLVADREDADGEERGDEFEMAPSLDLMSDLSAIGAVAADDRCLNKLPTWTDGSGHHAVAASTLSILGALKAGNTIDEEAHRRARHKLRAAGYIAVPLEPDELKHYVLAAPIIDGKLRETPELKAVRESISIVRINSAFVEGEEPWLTGVRVAVYGALREIWMEATNLDHAEAQGDWLLCLLPDPLAWCLQPENDLVWAAVRQQLAIQIGVMMVFLDGPRQKRYFAWLEDRLLSSVRKAHPEIWDASVEFLKSYIARLMETTRGT